MDYYSPQLLYKTGQPWPQTSRSQKGEAKTHSQSVCLGAGEMEGPGELGWGVQNGFLEEVSMGISKQFTTFFKINIAFNCFLTA